MLRLVRPALSFATTPVPPGRGGRTRAGERASRWLSGAALALVLLAPAAVEAQLTPEQVTQLRTVTATALSPEGDRVAFTVSVPRTPQEDTVPGLRAVSELWVMGADGGEPRPLVTRPRAAGSPAWSPDGSRLAFLHQGQVHVVEMAGLEPQGDPVPLTDISGGVMAFQWSPDGASVAFTSRVPLDPEVAARRARGDDVQVSEGAYLPWVYPPQAPRPIRLWVQPVDGREARALTPEALYVRDFAWAPGSDRLALQVTDEGDADADLLFRRIVWVAVGGGPLEPVAPTEGKLGPMAWSPDGRRLAWLGAVEMNDPLAQSLLVAEPGGEPRNLVPDFEGSLVALAWEGTEALRFLAIESTRTAVRRIPLAGGEPVHLLGGGAEIFQAMSLSADGTRLVAPANTAAHPSEVFVAELETGAFRRLTDHNPVLSEVRLARQEVIRWTARDGMEMEGILLHPLDAVPSVRPPLAVLPHGGPEGFDLDGWGTRALYPAQVLAGAGFAVFLPNYRGSGGRGVAFTRANHRDLGGREFHDVLDGIDHLHAQGLADRDRVGISGTSYGGYFSALGGTRYAERFRLAMPFAGLSNWMSFMGTTDIPFEMALTHWDFLPWENPLLLWERSPVAHITPQSTPMVIGQGMADERVHPEQMIQLHQLLRLQGVPSDLVLYPREPHGLLERQHQLDYMNRILEAFDRWVRPVEPPARVTEAWSEVAVEMVRQVDAFLRPRAGEGEDRPEAARHRVVDLASFDTLAAHRGWPATTPEAWKAAFAGEVDFAIPARVPSGRCSETCAMEGRPRVYSLGVLGEPGRWDAPSEFEGLAENELLAVVRVGFNVGREGEPHPTWRSGYQEHFFVLDAAPAEAPRLVRKLDVVRIATGPAPR